MTSPAKETFRHVIDASARRLGGMGFHRRGNTLRKLVKDAVAIVEFQGSTKNTADCVLFTVNLAIFVNGLMEEGHPPLTRVGSIDAHFRDRIGMLLPGRPDKWWDVNSGTDETSLASEVSDLLEIKAVPYLERYLEIDSLVALWESGKSPGLTEGQRKRYLARAHAIRATEKLI